jgi:hypothetical protein
MSAPLIVHDARDKADRQEVIMMLADFSFTPPELILEQLRMDAHTHHVALPTLESGGHLNDVKYDAFLANDHTLADPQVVTIEQGGRTAARFQWLGDEQLSC